MRRVMLLASVTAKQLENIYFFYTNRTLNAVERLLKWLTPMLSRPWQDMFSSVKNLHCQQLRSVITSMKHEIKREENRTIDKNGKGKLGNRVWACVMRKSALVWYLCINWSVFWCFEGKELSVWTRRVQIKALNSRMSAGRGAEMRLLISLLSKQEWSRNQRG